MNAAICRGLGLPHGEPNVVCLYDWRHPDGYHLWMHPWLDGCFRRYVDDSFYLRHVCCGRPFHSYRHLCWRHQRRPNLCVPAENSRDLSISCHHLGRLSHGQAWQAGGCTVSWCVCLLDWWHIFCYCPGDHSAAAIQGHIKVRALGVLCTDFFQYLRSALHGQF